MSVEIDSSLVRQLSGEMKELTAVVIELKTGLAHFGPVLQSQVSGLTDCVNRTTRLEDGVNTIREQIKADKDAAAKERENAQKQLVVLLSFLGVLFTALNFILSHVAMK